VQKTAGAAAILCMGFVLELGGFEQGVTADNAWKLMLVATFFPAVLTGLAAFLGSRLRLDERAHAQVQSELRGEPRVALRGAEA
jgi:Na+/melibiose symporter-like transporter